MSFEIDFEEIAKHVQNAIAKHPNFCEKITKSPQPILRKLILDNVREIADKTQIAEYILSEEIAEIFDAYDNDNPKHAIYECYDAIAVLIRMIEKIKENTYPWEE